MAELISPIREVLQLPTSAIGPQKKIIPPSDDVRWRIVMSAMRRHGNKPSALIETLHTVQNAFGYLDETAMAFVGRSLHVPLSKVYGVATFYSLFRLKPGGNHNCVVCMGTACYIKGAQKLLEAIEDECGLHIGETSSDNNISLLEARCLGACGIAPAVILDGHVLGHATAKIIEEKFKEWQSEDE